MNIIVNPELMLAVVQIQIIYEPLAIVQTQVAITAIYHTHSITEMTKEIGCAISNS